MSTLLESLARWRPAEVLLVGDLMVDQLVLGDAERLTADAPVPVLEIRETRHVAGGAANVALNLAALGMTVRCVGVVGDDANGRWLIETLRSCGVDTQGVITDDSRPTTTKQSLVGLAQHRHPQKMFRLDHESREPVAGAVRDALLRACANALRSAAVVAIEDYDKGVLKGGVAEEVIALAAGANREAIVDPAKLKDYDRYRGATAVTPNRTEAEHATGLPTDSGADIRANTRLAAAIQERFAIENVVLTLDRHGALLAQKGRAPVALPTVAREVYDVTGAGDMVLAALVAARANGIDWPDAVRFANSAAGLEVEVFGVQPIPFERIHRQVLVEARALRGKQRSLEEAEVEVAAARKEGKRIVFTNGCFDLLHAGHIRLLQRAAAFGDFMVVGLNSDDSVRRLKGPERPVNSEDDRVAVMSELASVGIVVVFDEDTPTTVIERLRPDVLVKGGDYSKDQVVGRELVESWGGRIELIPHLDGRSTTSTIARLRLA